MTAPAGPPRCADHRVERASTSDIATLSHVIAGAFFCLAVSQWLVPDPDARRAIFPGYFAIYLEHALAEGLVLTTPARDAAALWMPVGPDGPGEPPAGYHGLLAAFTGPHLARFEALDEAFGQHHPIGIAHEHLAILAVRPGRQHLGVGTALLDARHFILDRKGMPAYLEACDLTTREIYRARGYTDLSQPIQLPDGPALYPMWRNGPDRPGTRR
jgi:GNAT superfamily N-acetyltransferase